MNMKVFWVLGWDRYYPEEDNFLKSFETLKEAQKYIDVCLQEAHHYDRYDIIDISGRL